VTPVLRSSFLTGSVVLLRITILLVSRRVIFLCGRILSALSGEVCLGNPVQ
jgi:hypothetical protein